MQVLLLCLVAVAAGTTVSTYYTTANFNCNSYCTMALAVCNSTNAVYSSVAACMGTCAIFIGNASLVGTKTESGASGSFLNLDTTGNTASCRFYHIEVARGLPDTHCPHGGVASTQCNDLSPCEGYCSLTMQACANTATTSAALGNGSQWDSYDHCYAGCENGFSDTDSTTTNVLGLVAGAGDDLACRAYHTSVATFANFHCQHGNAASATCYSSAAANPVAGMCEGFCEYVQSVCFGNEPYTSVAVCQTACLAAAWPDATGNYPWPDLNSRTNTMGCRIYHATVAISSGLLSTHCPHVVVASPVCVNAGTTGAATTAMTTGMATTAATTGSATTGSATATTGSATAAATTTTTTAGAAGLVPSLLVLLVAVAFA